MKDQARTVHPAQHNPDGGFQHYRFSHKQTILAEELCNPSRYAVPDHDMRLVRLVDAIVPVNANEQGVAYPFPS